MYVMLTNIDMGTLFIKQILLCIARQGAFDCECGLYDYSKYQTVNSSTVIPINGTRYF